MDNNNNNENNTNQDELVSQFLAVTGSSDVARAVSYLEMSGGVLETAVSLFLEHNPPAPPTTGTSSSSGAPNALQQPSSSSDDDHVRAPDATRTMRLMDHHHHTSPMMMNPGLMMMMQEEEEALMSASGSSSFAFGGGTSHSVRDVINRHAAAAESMRRRRRRRSVEEDNMEQDDHDDDDDDGNEEYVYVEDNKMAEDDDEEDTAEEEQVKPPSRETLQDMFAPPVHLMHVAGGFQGARAVAKDSRRWLLVNLQRDSEFACHALNRDVWRDELVENLVREGFIFWQAMDISSDGRTYAERYQVHEYPHVAILDPRTGRLMWRKEGWTQEKPLTAMNFAELVMDFCSRHSFDKPPVAAAPMAKSNSNNKKKRSFMTEQEQLQEAMRASLKKEDSDDDDEEEDVEFLGTKTSGEEDQAPTQKQEEEEKPKEPSQLEEWLALEVGEEPADGGARIQIRMPDAKRLVRKFSADSPVKTVYAFVAQSNEEARGGREFLLMAGFPPRDLMERMDSTIESCGLAGQAITVRWK